MITKKPAIGDLIDRLYLQDQRIKDINDELSKAREMRNRIETRVMKRLNLSKLDGARGKHAVAFIKETRHAKIGNRAKLIAYIVKKKAFDLFTNAVATRAYFDRLDEGEKVPGVEIYTNKRVGVTKVK